VFETGYENEESVGRAVRESGLSRSDIYITSKYSDGSKSPRASIEASLSKVSLSIRLVISQDQ